MEKVRIQDDLYTYVNQAKLEELVRNKVASLGSDEEINSMTDDDFEIKDFDDEL